MLWALYQLWGWVIENIFTVSPLCYLTYGLPESGWVRTALNSNSLGGAESSKINTFSQTQLAIFFMLHKLPFGFCVGLVPILKQSAPLVYELLLSAVHSCRTTEFPLWVSSYTMQTFLAELTHWCLVNNSCLVEWLYLRLNADSVRELVKWVKRGGALRAAGRSRLEWREGENRAPGEQWGGIGISGK